MVLYIQERKNSIFYLLQLVSWKQQYEHNVNVSAIYYTNSNLCKDKFELV